MIHKFPDNRPRVALFAGSFDPFTIGHASIVERALPLFDRIVVAVGTNVGKTGVSAAAERVAAIRRLYPGSRVDVLDTGGELTVDVAARVGARWLLRGVRSVKDFEYERDMADVNRRVSGIETVLMYSLPELSAISSSVVRELRAFGRDVSEFLPKPFSGENNQDNEK